MHIVSTSIVSTSIINTATSISSMTTHDKGWGAFVIVVVGFFCFWCYTVCGLVLYCAGVSVILCESQKSGFSDRFIYNHLLLLTSSVFTTRFP